MYNDYSIETLIYIIMLYCVPSVVSYAELCGNDDFDGFDIHFHVFDTIDSALRYYANTPNTQPIITASNAAELKSKQQAFTAKYN